MKDKLILANSIEYFNNVEDINISLILSSPSYYTDTPKRNKISDKELGVGEDKNKYVELLTDVFKGITKLLTIDSKVIMLIGRYNDLPVESLILNVEDSFNKIGLTLNNYKTFGKNESESIVIFEKRPSSKIEIPNFDKLQSYEKVGFFGEIDSKVLDWGINSFSKENELVVDPFAGTGSTIKRAIINNRDGLGIDINPKNIEEWNKSL